MKREFTIIIEEGKDGYFISEVIELPGCHTQGKTLDELISRTREAIELYIEREDIDIQDRFIGIQKITI